MPTSIDEREQITLPVREVLIQRSTNQDLPAVRRPIWFDVLVLLSLSAVVFFMVHVTQTVIGPRRTKFDIDLSAWALPRYLSWSLLRCFVAFGFSLIFTVVYGYIAAKYRTAERFMIPLLDILQSVPVLGFMPSLMLSLIALFPDSNFGLELASIIMIFTGQVWNMTFSFYHSLRTIPNELREASRIYRFNWWRTFWKLELPYSIIPLVWNAKVSMAGGWFFLTVCEAFQMGSFDFRLPGIGSYMSQANATGNTHAILWGILAMTLTIIIIDHILWRPVIAWAQRFKYEETAGAEEPSSLLLDLFRQSHLVDYLGKGWQGLQNIKRLRQPTTEAHPIAKLSKPIFSEKTLRILKWFALSVIYLFIAGLLAASVFGGIKILHLVANIRLDQWLSLGWDSILTLLRIIATLILASLWAIPVGILVGLKPKLSRFLQPVIQVAASFPAPMIYPLVLSALHWCGISLQVGSIFLLILGAQWYILFNATAGTVAIPHELAEATEIYRFSRGRVWKRLYLPAVFPSLITGWIVAAGGAWNASIVAEYVHYKGETLSATGLGAMITLATENRQFDLLAAGVMIMVVIVVALNRLCWEPLFSLARERYSMGK
jgi:NitT/TauT family transport system permease protein